MYTHCKKGDFWLTAGSPQLIIPKFHGEKLADIPDDHLTEILVCITTLEYPYKHTHLGH